MNKILISGLLLATAACASSAPLILSSVDYPPHPRLQPQYARAKSLSADYELKERAVAKERQVLNGVSLAAGLATLGFGAFDAHADNITAAALTTGITSAARPLLGTDANLKSLGSGRRALDCIMVRAGHLRLDRGQVSPDLTGGAKFANAFDFQTAMGVTDNIETLDLYLGLLIGLGESQPSPDQGLKSALEDARQARVRIAIGVKARREAPARVDKAIDAVAKAVVYKRADMSALLEAIAKVEVPKPEPSTGAGGAGAGVFGVVGGGTPSNGEITDVLNILSNRIRSIVPEMEEEILKTIAACPVEHFAS